MTHGQRLLNVRQRLVAEIAAACGADPSPAIERESMLIREDHFVGRVFTAGEFRGVWLIGPDQLKLNRDGVHLDTFAAASSAETAGEETPSIYRIPTAEVAEDVRRAA